MKHIVTIISILSLFISCDKSEDAIQPKQLPGDWTWTASCGGFSGACSYPDDFNFKSIRITEDRFLQKINGQVTIDNVYRITKLEISETNYPYEKNYQLTLGDDQIIEITFIQNKDLLYIGNNGFSDSYKRD